MAPRGHGDPRVSCCLVTVREKRRGDLRDVDFRGAEQTELGSSLGRPGEPAVSLPLTLDS